ncbi:MAG: 16S rRNA (cytidine(1402)-2'-O)-methyltransferase [Candidatus Kerfeldbacteria bacterium RIFOXYA2_FULL_38_24]|uniref:Ribosomal RNA small subunit methyltransferase I n=1 Tax=Candidatus Kerfeldbacteria bacterium RIFOXYB2_FULL_38_14 TaxID=1798547 RepID=A0A1G2BCR2_9BACT|nr:MAG: 16S rRNA (cytidine(1402)-2'-O)-methyltransferase [Candidatus Kerfeldbacteria bacterium RIFOXYA2_FULL_38_24]OGY86944.1 MAG: 16S rRNA (cytidine(1402)-2'-O)-methyltransferase [Candidatus Kerfeldbacteria bacterium RIFOXYB2_FULL_38_14]
MGKLYTVATPIGNLGDVTYRAIAILKEVDLIACEDTREARKLLDYYQVTTPLLSYHAQSGFHKEEKILQLLQTGKSVALISDRGTPTISDPGASLVRKALAKSLTVIPIPGASALITALQASGADTAAFSFLGFIPHKKGRQTFLKNALDRKETVVFYESCHRVEKCLQQLLEHGAEKRQIIIARELTKQFEEFMRGTAAEVLQKLQQKPIRGEFVVILERV